MDSVMGTGGLAPVGCPIRIFPDQTLVCSSPRLFAAYHVLHRLPMPRHPPYALSSLTIKKSFTNANRLLPCITTASCAFTHMMLLARASYQSYAIVKDRKAFKPLSSSFHSEFGGGDRVRTDGLLRARQALSQLSYTP